MGMIPTAATGPKRKKRGVPLRALTRAAIATGNPSLDDDQRAVVAAWLKLSKEDQRDVVEQILSNGGDEMTMDDVSSVGGMEDLPADMADVGEEPVVTETGTATVVDGQEPWSPEEEKEPALNDTDDSD